MEVGWAILKLHVFIAWECHEKIGRGEFLKQNPSLF